MTKDFGNNMMLYTSYWGNADTFKLMPVSNDCPFVEAIYDPATTLLVVISKTSKENFQYVPRLDDQGDPIALKHPRANGKTYREQRVNLTVLQEFYLIDKDEQEAFIKKFAVNADTYKYDKYLRDMSKEPTIIGAGPEKQGLVDANGLPLNKK